MPRGDRTGPAGGGPMTGRAAGWCAGSGAPGFAGAPGAGFRWGGPGDGFGRGARRRGRGRAFAGGYGSYGWYDAPAAPENRRRELEAEAEALGERLKYLQREIAALGDEKGTKPE
ncbi:MAG: DUF5320 domain-containing protein [Spirochaetota bacterium]